MERYIHTNFELNRSGEQVILTAPSGLRCDEVVTDGITIDFSMGRRLDSPSEWVSFDRPTPGAENDSEPFLGFTGTVSLSPGAGFYPEAISVTLTSSAPDRVANYWQDWERPIHVEFFEPEGGRGFSLDAGVRIFGWGSRSNPQKSLSILFRDRYGAGRFSGAL